MGPGDVCRVPPAAPRESQAKLGTRMCGYCRRVLWEPGSRGQYSGIIVLSRNFGTRLEGSSSSQP